jgi:hypothetical protein
MSDFSSYVLLLGFSFYGLFWIYFVISDRFKKLENSKIWLKLKTFLIIGIMLCGLIFVVSILDEVASQPSSFEACMEGVENSIDPEAIAWMEEYCYENR